MSNYDGIFLTSLNDETRYNHLPSTTNSYSLQKRTDSGMFVDFLSHKISGVCDGCCYALSRFVELLTKHANTMEITWKYPHGNNMEIPS